MSPLVDLAILLTLGVAAYTGKQEGALMMALEILSLSLASVTAFLFYTALGSLIHKLGSNVSLSRIVAFVLLWVVVEIAGAVLVRVWLFHRWHISLHLTRAARLGGAILNSLKYSVIIVLALISLSALPGLSSAKAAIAESFIGGQLLILSGPVKEWLAGGLGHDLAEAFNFYTVTTDPESTKRIDLGFTTSGPVNEAAETAMLKLVNHERLSRGLEPLRLNVEARGVARSYATKLFAEGFFSHLDNEGNTPFDRLKAAGIRYNAAGENLALAPTLQLAHQGLMNSPGHRANILNSHYHTVGIGIIDGGPYGLMIAQEFTD